MTRNTKEAAPMQLKTMNAAVRIKSIDETGVVEGYGSVFGVQDWYGDIVEPGAFDASLKEWSERDAPIPMLWQHFFDQPIGYWDEFSEDDKGLLLRGRLLHEDIQKAREAYRLLQKKAITGLSIGFNIPSGGARWDDDADALRIYAVDLWEVSIVTFPANVEAQVEDVKRAFAESISNIREFETALRDAMGFSRGKAKVLASLCRSYFEHRDDAKNDEAAAGDMLQSLTNIIRGKGNA